MATRRIGYSYFNDLRGQISPPARQLEAFKRAGQDGTGYVDTGERGKESSLTSVVFLSAQSQVNLEKQEYSALVGDVVSIVDGNGTYWANVMVVDVGEFEDKALAAGAGGALGAAVRFTARWTVQAQ